MEKNCLECGSKIIGRSDKKYCDEFCKNAYHNKLDVSHKHLIRNIHNILKKNYKILCELNQSGKTKVHKKQLVQRNFMFNYMTSLYQTKTGKTYCYIYNQAYLFLEDDWLLLVTNDVTS